jgi:hypothetical protein
MQGRYERIQDVDRKTWAEKNTWMTAVLGRIKLSRSWRNLTRIYWLGKDRDLWRALVSTVMNPRVRKRLDIPWVAESISASLEIFCCMVSIMNILVFVVILVTQSGRREEKPLPKILESTNLGKWNYRYLCRVRNWNWQNCDYWIRHVRLSVRM